MSKIRIRYLGVVTYGGKKGSQLIEYTGHGQEARVWLANSKRWARTVIVDTLSPRLADVRPAWPHDLKRFGFSLPAGQVLSPG